MKQRKLHLMVHTTTTSLTEYLNCILADKEMKQSSEVNVVKIVCYKKIFSFELYNKYLF